MLLVVFYIYSHAIGAKEIITWVNLDNPPWYINSGPQRGNGVVDQTLQILKEKLTNYEHKHIKMTAARWTAETKKGTNICIGLSYKTKARLQYTAYSIPSNILLSAQLIINKNNRAKFSYKYTISLASLLKDKNLTGIFEKDRSNSNIDSIVENYKNQKNIQIKAVRIQQMYQMVMLGRQGKRVKFIQSTCQLLKPSSCKHCPSPLLAVYS